MQARQYEPLSTQIEEEIERITGLSILVEDSQDGIHLIGLVDSSADSGAAEDIARQMAQGREIINDLELEEVLGDEIGELSATDVGTIGAVDPISLVDQLDPDFTNQPTSNEPVSAADPTSSVEDLVNDGDVIYFPPTDPVIGLDEDGDVEVLGGFSPTSDDDIQVEPSTLDGRPGDEALAAAIRRELREDASTTALQIEVTVKNGIVKLRGEVPDLIDAENAEAVARTVPGVVDVDESLKVTEL